MIDMIWFSVIGIILLFLGSYFFKILISTYRDCPRDVLPALWLYVYLFNFSVFFLICIIMIYMAYFSSDFLIQNKMMLVKTVPILFCVSFYFSAKYLLKISTTALAYEKEYCPENQRIIHFWERMNPVIAQGAFESKFVVAIMLIIVICLIYMMEK